MSSEPPSISILMVNFNGTDLLPACLDSLRAVLRPKFEIIVVDNASSDNSLKILEAYPECKIVRSESNLGFAGGNNLGLAHCQGRLILLLNTDTICEPDFLHFMVDYLQTHPEVAIAQGKMLLSRQGDVLDACGSFLTRFGWLYHYGYYKADSPKYCNSYRIFSAKGACLLFRREIIAQVGGYLFDSDYFCYYEETDFCHRAWLAGYEVHFVHSARILHLQGATASRAHLEGFSLNQFLRNQTFGLFCNLSASSTLWIMPFYCLLMALCFMAGVMTGKKTVARASLNAILFSAKNLKKIWAQRRVIRKIRKISDSELFRKVMITPRLSYFLKTFTGKLACYQDEELPI